MHAGPIAPVAATIAAPAAEILRPAGTGGSGAGSSSSFIGKLEDAINRLNDSLNSADQLTMRLAAGEDVDLHEVMIALESASIGLQTAIQIRNKAVDAYREIMAMPL